MPKLHTVWGGASVAKSPSLGDRDLRVDFFRGLALFCIFIDHMNIFVAWFTLQAVMCADAAEVFVFISGFTSGMVYGRTMERDGILRAGIRVYRRVWQIYIANIVLFMTFMATLWGTVSLLKTSRYIEHFAEAAVFLKEPGVGLVKVLSLQFQPSFMDILPLYVVCLALLPFALSGFRLRPGVVIFACLLLWLIVQFDERVALPAWPGQEGWGFNPFAWQALYYLAAWLGWRSNHNEGFCLDRRWVLYPAAGLALAGLLLRLSWTLQGFYGPIMSPIPGEPLWRFMSKTNLGLIPFVNILAVALLVGQLTRPQARFVGSPLARPFVLCGRYSLQIFCLGILLTVFGQLVLNEVFGRWPMQLAVAAAGIAIMVGFAALLEWFAAAGAASRTAHFGQPVPRNQASV